MWDLFLYFPFDFESFPRIHMTSILTEPTILPTPKQFHLELLNGSDQPDPNQGQALDSAGWADSILQIS